jgi:hypothetical protein
MSGDDDLRARLGRIDPSPTTDPVDPFPGPRAHELMERAMTIDENPREVQPAPRPVWRRPLSLAAGVVLIAAAAVGAVAVATSDDDAASPATTLHLKTADTGGGASMGSCIAFDVSILEDMPVAFAGTVTDVDATSVTIDVDHWYKGGTADVVTVSPPDPNSSVALDGVEFTRGQRYLVTANDGVVNTCGFSGPATAEFEQSFEAAFGG